MGIEEYKFLTRTMEEISELSTKLTDKRFDLSELYTEKETFKDKIYLKEKQIKRTERKLERINSDRRIRSTSRSAVKKELSQLETAQRKRKKNIDDSSSWFYLANTGIVSNFVMNCIMNSIPAALLVALLNTIDPSSISFREFWRGFFLLVALVTLIAYRRGSKKYNEIGDNSTKIDRMRYTELAYLDQEACKREIKSKRGKLKRAQKSLSTIEQGILDEKFAIARVEVKLATLWDSIAHLIPYSTALEKA